MNAFGSLTSFLDKRGAVRTLTQRAKSIVNDDRGEEDEIKKHANRDLRYNGYTKWMLVEMRNEAAEKSQ